MVKRTNRIFLDTSVIFAAVLSETGGARKLFRLGEAGALKLIVGSNVLRECEQVIRRKAQKSLPTLAYLLELGRGEIISLSQYEYIEQARAIVAYEPDEYVLAEAIGAEPDWFITHDKAHFLKSKPDPGLSMRIGTPGDLIDALREEFTKS